MRNRDRHENKDTHGKEQTLQNESERRGNGNARFLPRAAKMPDGNDQRDQAECHDWYVDDERSNQLDKQGDNDDCHQQQVNEQHGKKCKIQRARPPFRNRVIECAEVADSITRPEYRNRPLNPYS